MVITYLPTWPYPRPSHKVFYNLCVLVFLKNINKSPNSQSQNLLYFFWEHHFDHIRPLAELAAEWHSAPSAYHPARKRVSLPPFIFISMLFSNTIESPVKSTVSQESPAALAVSSANRP